MAVGVENGTRVTVRWLLGAVLAASACGGAPLPVPGPPLAADAALRTCPPPVLREPGRVVPRRVRLVNETPDTLEVWLDRCFWHTRLASVPPGRALHPRLPDRLVEFAEGLRFHANARRGQLEYVGVFTTPLEPAPIVELVLSDTTRSDPEALERVVLADSVRTDGSGFMIGDTRDGGYAALFARETAAVLSWACGSDGARHLTLSASGKLDGAEVAVRLRVDGGRWEDAGPWRVQAGTTDAAVAPDERVDDLTARALEAREFAFVLEGASGRREAHAFALAGLAEALSARACFRPLAAAGGSSGPD